MAESHDWTPYVDAGLIKSDGSDQEARRQLLEFLIEQGCEFDEMVEADRRGRLFGLAGDRIISPGAQALTLADVAEQVRGPEAAVRQLWRALGLPGWDGDEPVASRDDATALRPLIRAMPVIGEDRTIELARSIGHGLSRIGDATNAILRSLSPVGTVATSGSELETATYWARNATFLPALGRVLDVFFRHHHDLARVHFEQAESYELLDRRLVRSAVAFVDMSGFTSAAEGLDEDEFARLVTSFSTWVGETVHDLGGRVVKFVGDAAMLVAPMSTTLATIVGELIAGQSARGGLTLHAGLAQGELLNLEGDYFGSPVNIAARLAALADPGAVLATAPVGEALADAGWDVEWAEPRQIRGIADPIATCIVHRR